MPRTAMAVLIFGLTLAATAAANPVAFDELYIDFDPPNRLHSITPAPYTTVDAYVVAEFLEQGWPDGFSAVSFRLSNPLIECPGVMATAVFTSILPYSITQGPWDEGITITTGECLTDYPIVLARLSCFYLGRACDIKILNHPDYPHWVVDCGDPGEVFYYCIPSHGGIAKLPDDWPDVYCPYEPTGAVNDISWSVIKSMYR